MKTSFESVQYNVTKRHLSKYFNKSVDKVDALTLYGININPSGYGHYDITALFYINEDVLAIKRSTTNMQLIDAWKCGMSDSYENGEDGFNNWDEVVNTMLSVIDPEESIYDLIDD